jgi:predicted transposase YdaD
MGEYDKILKENVEAILLTLGKKLLGFEIRNPVDLPEKLQTTIEREPDFLKKINLEDGSEAILHLEFQTTDEAGMVYRMAEYKAILQRKFEIPVRQFVIYLGSGKSRMRTSLTESEQIKGFTLRNIHKLPIERVLDSDIPEELVLSILTDYPKADADKVIATIIHKLKKVATNEAELKKSLQQLVTLSRIRKLEKETEKQIEAMPITYDIDTDYLYQKGIKKGITKGREEGREEEKRTIIISLLQNSSLSAEEIAHATQVPLEKVLHIRDTLSA